MSLLEELKSGATPDHLQRTATAERISADQLRAKVIAGCAVIPWARGNELAQPCAIGEGLRVKVNANIGTSNDLRMIEREMDKLQACLDAGADAVMDLAIDPQSARHRRSQGLPADSSVCSMCSELCALKDE